MGCRQGNNSRTTLPSWPSQLQLEAHSLETDPQASNLPFRRLTFQCRVRTWEHFFTRGKRKEILSPPHSGSLEATLAVSSLRLNTNPSTWDGIIDSMDMSLSKCQEILKDNEAWHTAVSRVTKNQTQLSE